MSAQSKRYSFILVCAALALCVSWKEAEGQTRDRLRELSIEDLMNTYVISSTQHYVRFTEAPSSVFVVTGDQVRRWGIRRLSELVERLVPGAITAEDIDDMILSFRGITADSNLKVLLLLNGHEYNTQWNNGPSSEVELGLLDDISRVEVLIGPHSALYGSGALLGVINMITRSGRDFSGIRLAGNYGSGNYRRADLTIGNEVKPDLNYFVSIGGLAANGYDNNNNEPLNISRFPLSGRMYASLNFKEFEFMSRFTRSARDFYISPASSTSPNVWTNYDTFFVDASRRFEWRKDLELDLNLTYDTIQTQRHDYTLGTKLRAVGEQRYGAKMTSFYTGWKNHNLVLGGQYRRDEFGDDWEGDNFSFVTTITDGVVTGIPADPWVKRVMTPYGRNTYALFGQDSIALQEHISLLLGFRFDRIEAPQITKPNLFSPRVALVINPNERTVFKAMFSSGVSRPLNAATTSPDAIGFGNPTILEITHPEKIHSLELSASHRINPAFEASLNVFYNSFRDIYGLDTSRKPPPFILISEGRIDYVGFEAIASTNVTDRTFLRIIQQHVQFGSVVNDVTEILTTPDGNHVHNYPEDVTKILADIRLNEDFSINTNTNLVWNHYGFIEKESKNTGFYALINLNLVWTVRPRTEIILSVYNLLNRQNALPPFSNKAQLAERNFNISASYVF